MADENAGDTWLHTGARLAGRYEVRARLGAGGMGVVYEVVDRESDEPIALKTLRRGYGDPQVIKREFRALADVTHPNLVQLYDLFDEDGRLCLTMELVPGVDLMSELRGVEVEAHTATFAAPHESSSSATTSPFVAPPLDVARVRDRFAQLARGLVALHRRGLVHRDVKPHNVRVTPEGRVVVLDFGLATVAGDVGALAGTVAYMAPEQADGVPVRAAADWYSFGVLLHEVLTGRPPWSGSMHEVLARKRMDDAPALRGRSGLPDDLAALADALIAREPDVRPGGEAVLERIGQRRRPRPRSDDADLGRSELVGRRAERTQLVGAWRTTLLGGSAWIAIEGASGLGKTALMASLAQSVEAVALHGRCYERESVAYKGIDQIVDMLAHRLDARGARCSEAADLVHAFPSVGGLVPAELEAAASARIGHDRRGAALRALIARLAADTPVLIALDDIQWADRDCLALLGAALGAPGLARVMVVVTARPDAAARWQDLPMPFVRIRLGALAHDEAVELAQHLLGRAALTVDASELARRSDGNALELVERVRAAVSESPMHDADVRAMVVRRVVAQAQDVRLVVELAIVAGAPVPAAAIGRATGLPEPVLRAVLDRAQLAGLLRTRRAAGRVLVEPGHDQVREVLFAALSPIERSQRASALAPVLESLGHEPAQVAELYVLACEPDAGRRCAEQAAERMTALGGHDAAAALWRQVAELSRDAAKRTAMRRCADSLTYAGRGSDASEVYLALARDASEPGERLRDLRRAAEELLRAGRIEHGLALIERTLAEWREPRTFAGALVRGLTLHGATRIGLAPRASGGPVDAATHEALELRWASIAGYTLGSPGHFVYAVEHHLRGALRSGDAEHISLGWSAEATLATFTGDLRFAEDCLCRAMAALPASSPRPRAVATATSALVQMCGGAWARAEAVAQEALALFDQTPHLVWERNTSSVISTTALLHRGQLLHLARGVRRERERLAASGDLYAHEIAHSGFTVAADLLLDEPERATARLEALGRRPTGVMTAWLRVIAHALVGTYGDRSGWHAARADELLRGWLALPVLRSPIVVGTLLWTRAVLELAHRGNTRTARRSIARLRGVPARGMLGLAELLDGHAALIAGDRRTARERGAAAELALRADDMAMFAASARWLVDPESWPAWRDALAQASAVRPERLARVFAPALVSV